MARTTGLMSRCSRLVRDIVPVLSAALPGLAMGLALPEIGVAEVAVVLATTLPIVLVIDRRMRRRLASVERGRRRSEAEQQEAIQAMDVRVTIASDVLDAAARRPWAPSFRPWSGGRTQPVALLPGADYHLPELVDIQRSLRTRGVESVIACGRPHWSRVVDGLSWYPDLDVVELPSADHASSFRAIVTMKDWAGYQPLIEAARQAGVPTFAKVEGVQDFHAADTPQDVRPYRHAGVILCQGTNDQRELGRDRASLHVVGNSRLEALWLSPPSRPRAPLVVVNLNFTGGVLASQRTAWVRSVVTACERADLPFVISLHPAERVRRLYPRSTSIGISRLLEHATVLISRFSTAPFEALARGVPFVYHNPHGEQVPTFQAPDGAFEVSANERQLAEALHDLTGVSGDTVRERGERFFLDQVSIVPDRSPGERAAEVILSAL